MKTYNVWYRFGTPPWVQQARPELVEATFDIKQVAGETGCRTGHEPGRHIC